MDNILHTEFDSTGDVTDLNDGEIFEEKSSEGLAAAVPKPLWIFGPKFSWYPTSKSPKSRKKIKKKKSSIDRTVNPYDNFMKRHLQHYGYYTGRNASFRDNFRSLQEWRRNYDARLSGYHDLSVPDEQFGKNGQIIEGPLFSSEGQLPDDLLHRTTQLVFHYQAGRKIPKLREPRNLYALTKEAGPQQATRWPSHMQVVCPAIRFLEYNPPIPDPLYKHTGKEPTPAVRGPQLGEMIYYNDPGRDLYFMRSRVAGCRLAMVSTTLTPREYPEDNLTLEFESRFESGNLLKVDKLSDFEYELTLRTDLYTNKHTQWFFFRVRNMRPEQTYRFTIVNLMKPSSLYNHGMRPVFYSEMNAKKNKIGWVRGGSNIRYYRNNLGGRDGRTYYGLTWTCEFPFKDDCCYFAHCFPYTYTDLQEYLLEVANDPVRSRICKQRVLCRTLAGNLVYILTITSPSRNPEISRAKRAVVLTARVHPGETNASWMMKGFLDYLTGNSADAKLLRDTFIFKIVPMLNPDGVIVGNYRCSLAGRDLNRNYKSVLKDSFPSIWHTKMMIKRLNSEREIVLYCDLHGHSRKNNIFIYGCENKHNPQKRLHERIFPLMLNKNASSFFCFNSCKYKVQKSKEGTGRIVMWYMGIPNSYTMEATFGGASLPGKRKDTHLSTRDLEMMGYYFCDTLLDYCDPDPSKVNACLKELQDRMRKQIMRRLQMQNAGLPLSDDFNIDDYMSEMESDTSGSDSSCDDGLPVHLLAIAPKLQRKKKMRSRRERSKVPATKTVIPSAADSSKQVVTTHSAKTTADKTKTLRYSQNSSARRRSEHHVTTSANQHQASNDDRSGDRSTKKECRTVVPLRTNKATFVQFTPPHKVITPSSVPSRKESCIVTQRSFSSCASLGPTPTCIRMRSGDCSNFRIENYVKAVTKQSNEDQPVALLVHKAEQKPQTSLTIPLTNATLGEKKLSQQKTAPRPTPVTKTQQAPSTPVNIWEMLFYNTNYPGDIGTSLAAATVASSPVVTKEILEYIGKTDPQETKSIITAQNITGAYQNLPSILATGSLLPSSHKMTRTKDSRSSAPPTSSLFKSPTSGTKIPDKFIPPRLTKSSPVGGGKEKKFSVSGFRYTSSLVLHTRPPLPDNQQSNGDSPKKLFHKTSIPSHVFDTRKHKWLPLRSSQDISPSKLQQKQKSTKSFRASVKSCVK